MDGKKLDLKCRHKCRNAWKQYEKKKNDIVPRGLSNAEYERAVRELTRKCRL